MAGKGGKPTYGPDAKLAELLKQREALKQKMKQELKDAQKHVEDAQRKRKEILEKQIRISQIRVSARERKTDARRKILIGAMVLSHVDQKPESNTALLRDLDEFLDRPRDRELFDLPPKEA